MQNTAISSRSRSASTEAPKVVVGSCAPPTSTCMLMSPSSPRPVTRRGTTHLGDQGTWVSIWVDDVDRVHKRCLDKHLEVTYPPTDEPWGVREMHVRHPDGHVFRISQSVDR